MKPKIYVCSRARIATRPEMWRTFRTLGANIISTWIDEAGEGQTEDMSELWTRIESEIEQCDRVVVFIRGDDLPIKGVFVEVGMAIAFKKPIYVFTNDLMALDPGRPLGSWVSHPLVKAYSGEQQLTMLKVLMGWEDVCP